MLLKLAWNFVLQDPIAKKFYLKLFILSKIFLKKIFNGQYRYIF